MNKKRIMQGLTVAIIIIICLLIILFINQKNVILTADVKDKINNELFEKCILENENISSENMQSNDNNTTNEKDIENISTADISQPTINKNQEISNKKNTSQNVSSKQITNKTTPNKIETKIKEQPKNNEKVEKTQNIQTINTTEEIVSQKSSNSPTPSAIQPKNTQNENVEKFVRNDAIINKIKQVIEKNVTEDMKKFGYSIQVDSSIKTLTNQFTFVENRVINGIRNKTGVIKIYAEDYYKNGQLIMTECYIL